MYVDIIHKHTTLQILLIVPFVTAILDFIYTIYQDVRGDAAKFQYLTPIVIAASMVSLTEFIKI